MKRPPATFADSSHHARPTALTEEPTPGLMIPRTGDAVVTVAAATGRIVSASEGLHALLGYRPADVRGRSFSRLFPRLPGPFDDSVTTAFRSTLTQAFRHRDGGVVACDLSVSAADEADDRQLLIVLRPADHDATETAAAAPSAPAIRDALTGLVSQQPFHNRLAELVRCGWKFVVALADVDGLRRINRSHGQIGGDLVLGAFGHLVARHLGPRDIAGRIGDDEIAILYPRLPLDAAARRAEGLRQRLAETPLEGPDGSCLRVTASFGLACFRNGQEGSQVLSEAGEALEAAKHQGGNLVGLLANLAPAPMAPDLQPPDAPSEHPT
ncbi:MAG: GGDEF domain-containing protein [Acidobacteriota bacterium]